MSIHSYRKDEHVQHALAQYTTSVSDDFLHTHFVHHSFPEINVSDVNLTTKLDTLTLETPFFINAMTGGSPKTEQTNHDLAIIARETNLALATGSVSVALKDPTTANSFSVMRHVNPNGLIFANLGAHHGLDNAKRAVELVQADALQIHVNTPQEIVMPEGERQFTGWLHNIEDIVNHLHVPVIVKEVGFGMSKETVQTLHKLGVKIVDVSGKGGTNFATIENQRRDKKDYGLFANWGQTTLMSLLDCMALPQESRPTFIASGGIKDALSIAKSLALGANAVGLSGHVLHTLHQHGIDGTIAHINHLKQQLTDICTLLGAKDIPTLQQTQLFLAPSLQQWCTARGIDWTTYAQR